VPCPALAPAVGVPESDVGVEGDDDDAVAGVPDVGVDDVVDVELVAVGASRPDARGELVTRGGAVVTDGWTGRREASQ
jgi:hypothetical protein